MNVIWVPSSRLMWANQLKKIDSSSVNILRNPWFGVPSLYYLDNYCLNSFENHKNIDNGKNQKY